MEVTLEHRKLSHIKELFAEKKRTDSRNEQLVYNRKRAIMRMEIRQLSNENMSIEDHPSNQSSIESFNQQIAALKHTITSATAQEDIWKALLQFDAIFKKDLKEWSFSTKQLFQEDQTFLYSLFRIAKDASLSDECKLGALQMLSEVTESFKQLKDCGNEAEATLFSVYLGIFKSAKTPRIFTTVLQGMSQLCLDNPKASEYFLKNGLYSDILEIFRGLFQSSPQNGQHAESLKDACILIHGLSLSKTHFEYADPRLTFVFEYLVVSNDSDIHYDVSTMLFHFTKSLASQPNMEWAKDQLDKLYSFGLMKVVISLIKHEHVWVPVRGFNILTNITYIRDPTVKRDFSQELDRSHTFELILETLNNPKLQIVLKYHIFLTLKTLVEANCILYERLNYLIQYITKSIDSFNSQIQKLFIEMTWEAFQKLKEEVKPSISQDLIRILCSQTQMYENDIDFVMKCLDVFDQIMQVSSHDTKLQKLHTKWLHTYNFNGIIHLLQLNKNQDISKKAVSVVSYLDSDEDSDSSSNDGMDDNHEDDDDEDDDHHHGHSQDSELVQCLKDNNNNNDKDHKKETVLLNQETTIHLDGEDSTIEEEQHHHN